MTIKQFDIEKNMDFILVTDSQDITEIKKSAYKIGKNNLPEEIPDINEFDSFFVRIKDGEYTEIYGFYGIIPDYSKELTKLL